MTEPILQVENLVKHFPVKKKSRRAPAQAVQVKPWALLANQDAEKPLPAAHS
jgi:hypothetical protein